MYDFYPYKKSGGALAPSPHKKVWVRDNARYWNIECKQMINMTLHFTLILLWLNDLKPLQDIKKQKKYRGREKEIFTPQPLPPPRNFFSRLKNYLNKCIYTFVTC